MSFSLTLVGAVCCVNSSPVSSGPSQQSGVNSEEQWEENVQKRDFVSTSKTTHFLKECSFMPAATYSGLLVIYAIW